MFERCRLAVIEGKRRAAVHRAELSPEALAVVEAVHASIPSLIARWFIGPEIPGKGRAPRIIVSAEELDEWRQEHPPIHPIACFLEEKGVR